jgi:hypothetical protein
MNLLPVLPAHRLAVRPKERRWLIEDLWCEEAVGILGGEPKVGKSLLALEMAVSVAGGSPCLRRFAARRSGRVLLYAAEDALHIVRSRLGGICKATGAALDSLDILVITAPAVRLDLGEDRTRLANTVARYQPLLLILDPFVRLHRIDENVSGEVAPLLAFLRELQRRFRLAIVLVHHAKKGAGHARAGQALRGTSEFHAWGDSLIYLRREDDRLSLQVEHRAAPSIEPVFLRLTSLDGDPALEVVGSAPPSRPTSAAEKIERALAESSTALSRARLRDACRLRSATLSFVLKQLEQEGRVARTPAGYVLQQAHA